jgi:hypothetical protein
MVRPHTNVHVTSYNKPLIRLNTMPRYKGRASPIQRPATSLGLLAYPGGSIIFAR